MTHYTIRLGAHDYGRFTSATEATIIGLLYFPGAWTVEAIA